MISVVGLPYNEFNKVKGDIFVDTILELRAEPENKFDRNAIAVYFRDYKIGHISKKDQSLVNSSFCIVKRMHKKHLDVAMVYIKDE